MGNCCSIAKPKTATGSSPPTCKQALPPVHSCHAPGHDTEAADQQPDCQSNKLFLKQQPSEPFLQWQQEHVSQFAQLQHQITLQSQEITKLREQVIDLQACRQQQQKQSQRVAYIQSQLSPSGCSHKLQIPQDCCAAAMECYLAIAEMKADLKAEGKMIYDQMDALLDSGIHNDVSMAKRPPVMFTSRSTFDVVPPRTRQHLAVG
ncbi:hypothetical protein ABBQ38_011164 [Trebouxia sp. C0009 RCD-2024]